MNKKMMDKQDGFKNMMDKKNGLKKYDGWKELKDRPCPKILSWKTKERGGSQLKQRGQG